MKKKLFLILALIFFQPIFLLAKNNSYNSDGSLKNFENSSDLVPVENQNIDVKKSEKNFKYIKEKNEKLKNLVEEQVFRDYKVTIYFNEESSNGLLEILKKGKKVFSKNGYKFRIGSINQNKTKDNLIKMGADITGDGKSDLVVSEWTGGAHSDFIYYIFTIDKEFKLFDVIYAGSGDLAYFKDIDNDSILEFVGNDWTFSYWNECFANSPAPDIILKIQDGKYRLSLKLMAKSLPPENEEIAIINKVNKIIIDSNENKVLPSKIWKYMLELIYTGHPNEAINFLDKLSIDKEKKRLFIKDFITQLKKSNYWEFLKKSLKESAFKNFI